MTRSHVIVDSDQYDLVHNKVGSFEHRHRAVLKISGGGASEYLQGQVTNDVISLKSGQGCYAALLTPKGRMVADMRILREREQYLVDTDPACSRRLFKHLDFYKIGRKVGVADESAEFAMISLIGPEAKPAAEGLNLDVPKDEENSHVEALCGEVALRMIRANLGMPVIDMIVATKDVESLKATLATQDIAEVSESVVECLRIEAGVPRYGIDMNEQTIPQEVGIVQRAVNFEKGCYVGQEVVARMYYRGHPNRHLRGLKLEAIDGIEVGATVLKDSKNVGSVKSLTVSPNLGPIGLAVIRREVVPGDTVQIEQNNAEVLELPFNQLSAPVHKFGRGSSSENQADQGRREPE